MQERKQGSAGAAAAPAAAAAAKPFLRRGAGWEARVMAAREGRRYVPRGGPVKDYSKEDEAPAMRRRSAAGAKPATGRALPGSPAKPASGRGGPAPAAARKTMSGSYSGAPAAPATKPKAAASTRQARSTAASAAASPHRPRPPARALPAAQTGPALPASDWSRRLLQAGQPAAATAVQAGAAAGVARHADEVGVGAGGTPAAACTQVTLRSFNSSD